MFGFIRKKTADAFLFEKDEKISKLNLELSEKLSELKFLKENHTELSNELESLKKTVAESNNADLTSQNEKFAEELKKTKKQLEDAEDEIEDLEDDLASEKKKHNAKKKEFSELQNKFLDLENEYKKTTIELEESKNTVEKQSETISIKNNSLIFVSEILSAKELPGKTADDFRKIDSVVEFIRGDFKDCLNEIDFKIDNEKEEKFFGFGLDYWANISKKTWLGNKKTVALVGEFSAGKTSIVNRILSQGGASIKLPVSTKATTAIPTYISGNNTETIDYRFFTPDNKLKILKEDTFKKVDKEILAEVEGISNLIKYFVMSCDNSNLKNLSILDTPGFTSNDKDDAERTVEVINECDALFWVFDVNNGTVNRSSLNIIKEKLKKPLFVVINKVDTKAPSEVNKVETLIKDTFEKENIEVKNFIRFSYKDDTSKILNVLDNVERSNETSNFVSDLKTWVKDIEKSLEEKLSEKGKKLSRLDEEVDEARDSIKSNINKVKDICEDLDEKLSASWTTHIFSKDKYEISASEGEEFENMLKKLRNKQTIILRKSAESYASHVAERTDVFNEYSSLKEKKSHIEECVKQLKKRLKSVE